MVSTISSELDQFANFGESEGSKDGIEFSSLPPIPERHIVCKPVKRRKFVTLIHQVGDKGLFRYLQARLHVGGTIQLPGKKVTSPTMLFQGDHQKAIKAYLRELNLLAQ